MGENKDVEAQIKDVYHIQNQKSTTTAADQTINQGFEGHVKNTDDETLDLNQVSDRQARNSSKVNPNSQTLLQTIEPIEAKQIEFGRESPNKEGTKSTSKIEEKSNEGDDDVAQDGLAVKKVNDGAENAVNVEGANKLDKSQGTQQSDERLNASQELLINKKGDEEPEKLSIKTIKEKAKRLYEWGRANPLKVIIIVLCIIIFSLLVSIPIKDWQIRTYPEEIAMEQSVLEGLRIRTADMERWVVQNKSRYERIDKNAEYMIKELLNQTNGPEGMQKRFTQLPNVTKYWRRMQNYSKAPTLPELIEDKTRLGGPLSKTLTYKDTDSGNKVEVALPDLFPKMSKDRQNILGVYNFRNVKLDSGKGKYDLFDMYIMLVDTKNLDTKTRLDRVKAWRNNEDKDSPVCCMKGGALDLNKYMNGYGVIIKHFNGIDSSGTREKERIYMDWIYEGEFRGGFDGFSGFGRFGINKQPTAELAVGYWSGFQKFSGKGVVFTNAIETRAERDPQQWLNYAGTWTSSEPFNKAPADPSLVDDLSSK